MPEPLWVELRDTCWKLKVVSPATKLVMVATEEGFDWGRGARTSTPGDRLNALLFAGLPHLPWPAFGCTLESFCVVLPSGWNGDPLLSGRPPSPVLGELFVELSCGQFPKRDD